MAFEAHIEHAAGSHGRGHHTERRLMRGTLYSVVFTAALVGRLMPWTWRAGRGSIFKEAKASTDRIMPMVFMG